MTNHKILNKGSDLYFFDITDKEAWLSDQVKKYSDVRFENSIKDFQERTKIGRFVNLLFQKLESNRKNPYDFLNHLSDERFYFWMMCKDLYNTIESEKNIFNLKWKSLVEFIGANLAFEVLPLMDDEDGIEEWIDFHNRHFDFEQYKKDLFHTDVNVKIKAINKLRKEIKETINSVKSKLPEKPNYRFDNYCGGIKLYSKNFKKLSILNYQCGISDYLESKISNNRLKNQIRLVNQVCNHICKTSLEDVKIYLQGNEREIRIDLAMPQVIFIITKGLKIYMTQYRYDKSQKDYIEFWDTIDLPKYVDGIKEFSKFDYFNFPLESYDTIIFPYNLPEYFANIFSTKLYPVSHLFFSNLWDDKQIELYGQLKHAKPDRFY